MDKRRGLRYHIEVVDYAARSEVISLNLMKKELQQFLHVTLFFFPHHCPIFKIHDFVKSRNQMAKKKIQMQGARIARSEAYMEPHSQACGIACYAPTGDILSKEHSPTAKPVMLCVEGEKYAAMTKDEAERSPLALLRAVSMSNGRWTFYEAVNIYPRLISSPRRYLAEKVLPPPT